MAEKKEIKKAVVFWIIVITYMAVIFFLSSRTWNHIPTFATKLDKVVHACIYVPLAFLVYMAVNKSGLKKYGFIVAFIFAAAYGITDEIHQTLVPGRIASISDFFADSFGAFVGSFCASLRRG